MNLGRPVPREQGAADCYPFGSSADPIFTDLRLCETNVLGLTMIMFFWTLACFCWRCGWCNLFAKHRNAALESLKFGANLLLKSSKKSTKSDQGCRRGGQHRSKGVPPQRFRKTGCTKNALQRERFKQMAPTWKPTFESLEHFGYFLLIFQHHFLMN